MRVIQTCRMALGGITEVTPPTQGRQKVLVLSEELLISVVCGRSPSRTCGHDRAAVPDESRDETRARRVSVTLAGKVARSSAMVHGCGKSPWVTMACSGQSHAFALQRKSSVGAP